LVDRDYIEWSNLQRQQLFTEADAKNRIPKAIAAAKRLREINSEIEIVEHIADVTPEEIETLLVGNDVDLILDATDNFDIRMIMKLTRKFKLLWYKGLVWEVMVLAIPSS